MPEVPDAVNEATNAVLIADAKQKGIDLPTAVRVAVTAALPSLHAAWEKEQRLGRVGKLVEDRAAVRARHFAEFKEALLGEKALQAGADAICIEKPATEGERNEVRIEIKAALSTLDKEDSDA